MSIDRSICAMVRDKWDLLGVPGKAPGELHFMKVQGKSSNNGSVIAMIYDTGTRQPVAVAKIPRNPGCTVAVENEFRAMSNLGDRLGEWPGASRITHEGFLSPIAGVPVLVQRAVGGYALVRDMVSREKEERIYSEVLPWLLEFHKQSAKTITLDGANLDEFVRAPVERFFENIAQYPDVKIADCLRNYLEALPAVVEGAELKLCAQHGDFNAHNIIVSSKDGAALDFTVIDWEDYKPAWLPIMDVNHFFISNSKLLDMTFTSEQAFEAFILKEGWYQNLYVDTVNRYQSAGIVSSDLFWKLTPLYMLEVSMSLMEEHRQQHSTLGVWTDRAAAYVEMFPMLPR